jgi:hypothetical protein
VSKDERPAGNGGPFAFQEIVQVTDDVRDMRDSIRKLVRNVLSQYVNLKHALAATSSIDLGALLARIEADLGRPPLRTDSPARDFVLTIDQVVTGVDAALGVKGACTAVAWRLIFGKSWSFIADGLHRSESRVKEIVDEATAKLFAEIVGRKITEDYRELPGLNELAA